MIDIGMLIGVALAFVVPTALARSWTPTTLTGGDTFLDAALGPAMAGLVVGRITTLLIEDPSSLTRFPDLFIIRSGVEFWPGVAAAMLVTARAARREHIPPIARLGDLAPLAMVGYAAFEASCVVRDGCFGPTSPVGLRPPGLSTTMLPIGLVLAIAITASAMTLHRNRTRLETRWSASAVVLIGVTAVAGTRSVASFWLPRIGDGLTRQHLTSIVVTAVAGVALVLVTQRHPSRITSDRDSSPSAAGNATDPTV